MSEPSRKPSRAEEEAAQWFVRLSRLSVTTAALREFREWRQVPENAAAYAALETTWDRSAELAGDADVRAAADRVLARRPQRRSPGRRTKAVVALGAVVACLLVLAAAVLLARAPATYRTGVGEQRLVALEDGSRVRLNTDTALTVRFDGEARRLTLERGQAHFEVAHDPARPFIVQAGEAEVRALGTRFDVWRDSGQVRVTLLEGRVSVAHHGEAPAVLRPAQEAVVTPRGLTRLASVDPVEAASWTTGRLVFRNAPLASAVAEVNRYSEQPIRLDAGVPAGEPVSGVFDAGDTQAFVDAVSHLFGLEASRRSGEIHLAPRRAAAS